MESARRTARYRPLVERAAEPAGLDADVMEAIVLLESAGRPDAAADPRLEGAVGLTQILASTGQGLLAMEVDTARSRVLTARIARARARGRTGMARRLEAARRRVDERFDPRKALVATARYLTFARGELGRDDLAVVSYHMGVGNLSGGDRGLRRGPGRELRRAVLREHAQQPRPRLAAPAGPGRRLGHLFLARSGRPPDHGAVPRPTPRRWPATPSCTRPRTPPRRCCIRGRRPRCTTTRTSSRTPSATVSYAPSPNAPAETGLRRARQMGELARRLEQPRGLYRGLRPEAYALALYLARLTRDAGGGVSPLTVTSTVRDREYQGLLRRSNPEATDELLAAHHRLVVRHPAPLLGGQAGPGAAVRAGPPRGAGPDRLGARAGRDPRDGVRRRAGARAPAPR